jgi:hypothetical protein
MCVCHHLCFLFCVCVCRELTMLEEDMNTAQGSMNHALRKMDKLLKSSQKGRYCCIACLFLHSLRMKKKKEEQTVPSASRRCFLFSLSFFVRAQVTQHAFLFSFASSMSTLHRNRKDKDECRCWKCDMKTKRGNKMNKGMEKNTKTKRKKGVGEREKEKK